MGEPQIVTVTPTVLDATSSINIASMAEGEMWVSRHAGVSADPEALQFALDALIAWEVPGVRDWMSWKRACN